MPNREMVNETNPGWSVTNQPGFKTKATTNAIEFDAENRRTNSADRSVL